MSPKTFRPLGQDTSANPEPEESVSASASAAGEGDAGHLDAVTVEEVEGTPMGEGGEAVPAVISRDQFHALFCGVFGMASAATGLKSLHVAGDDPRARPCTEAIYEIAEEVPQLRFLIEPGGVWMQRAFAIGAFAAPMALGVSGELRARKALKNKKTVNQVETPMPPQAQASAGAELVELH